MAAKLCWTLTWRGRARTARCLSVGSTHKQHCVGSTSHKIPGNRHYIPGPPGLLYMASIFPRNKRSHESSSSVLYMSWRPLWLGSLLDRYHGQKPRLSCHSECEKRTRQQKKKSPGGLWIIFHSRCSEPQSQSWNTFMSFIKVKVKSYCLHHSPFRLFNKTFFLIITR